MAPPSLGSGDNKPSWNGDFKKSQPLSKKIDLQRLKLEGVLVTPPLDLSSSDSLLNLSDGVGEDEWLLSASLAGSLDGAGMLDVDGQDWLTRHPSQEAYDLEKKLLVDMLDGIVGDSRDDDSVFTTPLCSFPESSSIKRIMKCHENSPYMPPLPSLCILPSSVESIDMKTKTNASSFLGAHLHSPTLSDNNPMSPTGILSLSPTEGSKHFSAANLTFDSLHSPPTKSGRSHSPPWPQLVSTPSAKPDNLAKSWQPAVNRLGQLVPPDFEPKVELSPPGTDARCLNTTETMVTISVQDTDGPLETRSTSDKLNTTQNMETPMNATHPFDSNPGNTTQTLGECPADTTQTMGEGPGNTTHTLDEGPGNTTQTIEDSPINTTQTIESAPSNVTSLSNVTSNGNDTKLLESVSPGCNTTNTIETEGNTTKILDDCLQDPSQSREVSPQNTTQTIVTSPQDKSPASHAIPPNTSLISNQDFVQVITDSPNSPTIQTKLQPSEIVLTKSLTATKLSSENESSKEDDGKFIEASEDENSSLSNFENQPNKEDFVRNSSFTGTYRVSPMLDSKGKCLPGPGVKAGLKKISGREIKQRNEKEKPNIQIPKSLANLSESKASAQSSTSTRSNIRSFDSSEKWKSVSASLNRQGSVKSTQKLKPNVMKNLVMKQETDLRKSVNPETEAAPSSGTGVRSRISVKLKPSTIVLPSKAITSSSSLEKLSSSQMKPPAVAPSKPSVTNSVQSQTSRLQPTRFQSRMSLPGSANAVGAAQAPLRPSIAPLRPSISGIRPPSGRAAAPSGIARLAGRHSMSASRLPLPGKF